MLIQQLLTTDKDVKNLLYAWGSNSEGQLGINVAANPIFPIQLGTLSWTAVSAGSAHSAAIRSDGLLFTWGRNNYGQVGDGTTTQRISPVQIGSSSWSVVSLDGDTSAAITSDGRLFTWGLGRYGGRGDGTTTDRSSPVQIGTGSSWISVGGVTHAIRTDGMLFAWGRNNNGQVGDGTTTDRSSPVQIGSSSWVAVSVGRRFAVGLLSGSTMYAWGLNTSGQLGDGTLTNKSSPVQIGTGSIPSSGSWTTISTGYGHTLAIRTDGRLFAWGSNVYGVLGDGTQTSRSSPIQIGSSSWSAVSAASNFSTAIRQDGRLFTWGSDRYGQGGRGRIGTVLSPVQIGSGSWSTLAAAKFGDHVLALDTGSLLYVWGSPRHGQLGRNNSQVNTPTILPQTNRSWKMVSAGGISTAAIRSDGLLFVWGSNVYSRLGTANVINGRAISPVQLGSSSWTAVSSGNTHTFAIRSDGLLFGWGDNSRGSLGDGTITVRSSPVQIGTGSLWNAVSAGNRQTLAIRQDGMLFAWGYNNSGQVGDGTTVNKSSPVQIGSSSWAVVSAGGHSAAITSDGRLFAWGYNGNGQIGDGTTVNKSSPVQVGTGSLGSWTTVSGARVAHTLAIRSDGLLFAWGRNSYGALGDGTTTQRISPVQIGSSSWTAVSTFRQGVVAFSSMAIRSDGALFTWGSNQFGQLGNGTQTSRSSPVQVGTLSWVGLSAGYGHVVALTGNLSNIQKTR